MTKHIGILLNGEDCIIIARICSINTLEEDYIEKQGYIEITGLY